MMLAPKRRHCTRAYDRRHVDRHASPLRVRDATRLRAISHRALSFRGLRALSARRTTDSWGGLSQPQNAPACLNDEADTPAQAISHGWSDRREICFRDRNGKGEGGPTLRALDGYHTAVRVDDALCDGEPKPHSLAIRSSGLPVALENMRQLLRRN